MFYLTSLTQFSNDFHEKVNHEYSTVHGVKLEFQVI